MALEQDLREAADHFSTAAPPLTAATRIRPVIPSRLAIDAGEHGWGTRLGASLMRGASAVEMLAVLEGPARRLVSIYFSKSAKAPAVFNPESRRIRILGTTWL